MKHDAQALGTDAYECDVDFVAGWNISWATQNAARNDCETHGRGGRLPEEFSPRN